MLIKVINEIGMDERHNKSGPNHPDCDEHPIAMECHDTREEDHAVLFDLDQIAAYKITHGCSIEGCTGTWETVEFVGRKPWTDGEFESVLYQLYQDFYENPRAISHKVLMDLIPYSEPFPTNPLSRYLAAAVDVGCEDATGEHKKSKNELLEWIGWDTDT